MHSYTITDNAVRCPRCQTPVDSATHLKEDVKPQDGDIAICFYCFGINRYVGPDIRHMYLEAVSRKELAELPLELRNQINEMRAHLMLFQGERNRDKQ